MKFVTWKRLQKLIFILILSLAVVPRNAQAQKQTKAESKAEIERLRKEVEAANERARIAEEEAKKYKDIAEQNKSALQKAENYAKRLRYIAQAKSMAIKSRELSADPELEALVAQMSYKFNTEYGGDPMDDDVYHGLYQAADRVGKQYSSGLQGHVPGTIRALVTNPQTGDIFSGGTDGKILRWVNDGTQWRSEKLLEQNPKAGVHVMALSPDGNYLIAGWTTTGNPSYSYLEQYDLTKAGTASGKTTGFSKIKTLIVSPNGDGVYVLEENGTSIKFTDLKTVSAVIKTKEVIQSIALSGDGNHLAGAGTSGALYVWDIRNGYAEKIAYQNTASLTTIAFSPDGKAIVFGDQTGAVKVLMENTPLRTLSLLTSAPAKSILFDHAGKRFVTVSGDNTIRLWNWQRIYAYPLILPKENIMLSSPAVFSADDKTLMIGFHGQMPKQTGSLHIWPTDASDLSKVLCESLKRNMTVDEWTSFVGIDLEYEVACGER